MSTTIDDTGQQFIDGRRRRGSSPDPLTVTNPSTGEVLATDSLASVDDVDDGGRRRRRPPSPAGPARPRPSARR